MSKYVRNNLLKDEQIVLEAKNHWIGFLSLSSLFTLGIYPIIRRNTDEYAITNKRLILKSGWLSVKSIEMNLSKIESVKVNRNIFGMILGYGDITVIGTGGTKETFRKVSQPMKFRKVFQELESATT